jgi:hypothetical protein
MEGEGGDGIVGEILGDWPIVGVLKKTRDEEVARIKWDACRIVEWHVIVWTDISSG